MSDSRKIINDPIHGFISINDDLIFDLVEHPHFQRLRRIRQLGLTALIYPGATHTRFHHALGAMHLMHKAIEVLDKKGVIITDEEALAAKVAILLHDIGHGPFSHVLERAIIPGIRHEELSLLFMNILNREFKGGLDLAIKIFTDQYEKRFLHQLVSSQLDMDRLDYLTRDSFYTGVSEGIVGLERIIQMLNVVDDQLVIDEKGIYSVEKFILARRLMYWQVYLHKTALAADTLLINIVRRARELVSNGVELFFTPNVRFFFEHSVTPEMLKRDEDILLKFGDLDDIEFYTCIKCWRNADDRILSVLSKALINRKLPSIQMQNTPFDQELIERKSEEAADRLQWPKEEASYLVSTGIAENEAYHTDSEKIIIKRKNGELMDLVRASDNYNFLNPNRIVRKYFLCTPK